MMDLPPLRHGALPPFFQSALELLQEGFKFFKVRPRELEMFQVKVLYKNFTLDLPDMRISDKFSHVNFPAEVWPRCALEVLEPAVRQLVFELVHTLRFVMPVLGHVLKHVPRHVLRHVPTKHVPDHVPGHVLEHMPQNRHLDPPSAGGQRLVPAL